MFNNLKKEFNEKTEELELAINDLKPLKNARRKRFKRLIFRTFFYIIGAYLAIFLVLCLIDIKLISNLTVNAVAGAASLNRAVKFAQVKDFTNAKTEAVNAQQRLSQSLEVFPRINNSPLAYLPPVSGQLQEVEHLLTATELISRGLSQGFDFASVIQDITRGAEASDFSSFSAEQKSALLQKIYESTPELNGISANLQLATNELNQLQLHGILWPAKYKILEVRNKIALGAVVLKEAVPISQILPTLAGYPDKSTFLLALQNSDELRATGGFLGTYGILETENGDISRLDTHDIYHMDMPSKDKVNITPPLPIKLYLNEKWYMRDANWYPDWPTSARNLEYFYGLENKYLTGKNDINHFNGQFNGVIAINPRLVISLLTIVGPISIDGQTYTADNFSQVLEFEVEQGYAEAGVSKWQRKEIIGKIVKQIKIKLFNLPSSQWEKILLSISESLKEKDLMFYFNDPAINLIAQENNWGGEIAKTENDYLMIVDSNFASLKTDSVMSREYSRTIERDDNGLKATLSITYKNEGRIKDWRTDKYKNYLRIYVPKNSKLIKFEGAAVPVSTYIENDKTVFGSLLYVELNSSKTITVSYYLPEPLSTKFYSGQYGLYWQKQPGNRVNRAKVDVKLPSGVKSINPQTATISADNTAVSWSLDLTEDKEIYLNY